MAKHLPEPSLDDSLTSASNYEFAGRFHEFEDLRSAGQAKRRYYNELDKYYSYKGVNRGQLGKVHYDGRWCSPCFKSEVPFPMTRKLLYEEAQQYPKPPRWHRSVRRDQTRKRSKPDRPCWFGFPLFREPVRLEAADAAAEYLADASMPTSPAFFDDIGDLVYNADGDVVGHPFDLESIYDVDVSTKTSQRERRAQYRNGFETDSVSTDSTYSE